MHSKFRPSTVILVLISAVLLAVVVTWLKREQPLPVQAAVVQRGPLVVRVVTNGKVEPVEDIDVRARLDGRVVQIPDAGRRVAAGDVVVRIDDGPVAAALAQARSERLASQEELRAARVELDLARERLATDRKLFEQKALTRDRYRQSEAAFEAAQARVSFLTREVPLRIDSLDLHIAELSAQKEAAILTAAFSGTIYRTAAKQGQMVHVGDPLLWIADLEHLRVRANIDQVDLGRVKVNQKVMITSNAFPGRSGSGRIIEVVPNVVTKESRAVSEALIRLDAPTGGLVPGMTVDVEIVVDETRNALQLPVGAIFSPDGSSFVYRIESGRAHRIEVDLGRSSIAAVEILHGLRAGDHVVVGPARGLSDEMRVQVQRILAIKGSKNEQRSR